MRRSTRLALIISPAFVLSILFGDYKWIFIYLVIVATLSGAKVTHGVLKFNDCSKDAEALRKEIIEAKTDLTKKGFKFVK